LYCVCDKDCIRLFEIYLKKWFRYDDDFDKDLNDDQKEKLKKVLHEQWALAVKALVKSKIFEVKLSSVKKMFFEPETSLIGYIQFERYGYLLWFFL
jgi:hypothetical protein